MTSGDDEYRPEAAIVFLIALSCISFGIGSLAGPAWAFIVFGSIVLAALIAGELTK